MVQNRIIFFATSVQPSPEEIDYWVDLSDNPYGGSIKYFNGTEWVRLAASGGVPDLSNYYTKTQVNKLLNDKANISDVDSKVDDEEVKDIIKDIQFNTSNPNGITMVMFKYDGSNDSISLPIASTGSAGIVTSKDFLDFVKQHQLQELHTEMIDTFADIRAKYQKKLIAGLNIEIDQETNVISASGDLAVQWDNITNKPDFKPVATSGDYNDLINKLKPGKDVSISEDNVISIAIDSDSLEQSLTTLQSNIDKEAAATNAALALKADKSDTYTKAQVDAKLSGAYKVKGSSTFEALPKDNNVVGDVYNITNAFNLGGKHYDAGTNVVWTEEGWDALSGSFDTTAIEGSIQELADNLAQEILDRTQADTTINNNVSSLTNRVKVNENKLTIINGNESTTGSIANAIKQAKSYTDTTVTAEQTRAEKAEQKLTSDLASQVLILEKTKVNKVEGKGLSTNDYTTPEKNKLAAIEAKANKYVLPAATTTTLGGIIVGDRLSIDDTGKLVATYTYTLPTASNTVLGGVKIGSNITNTNGTISLTKANVTSALGVDPTTTYVKKAGDTMTGALTNSSTISGSKLISTVSTGTAPIQVSSTTLCTNLNADMVDGYEVSNFNTDSVSIKRSINSVNQSNAENWIKLCTLPLTSQVTTQDKRVVFEIVGGTDAGEKYAYYATLTASTRVTENVELRILNSVDTISIATFIAGYVITSDKVEIWIRTSNQWGANTNIVCKYASTNAENILSSPATTQRPSNFVLGNIKTLDAPDWYGVSWSETSSNPDCTRIGNMDMHRSLPIQSMMKGYIHFKAGNPLHRMLKLNDNWTKCENYSTGGWIDVDTLLEDNNVNVMIKIPEFWWIDDYTESSETHNLKICPHAKPGWHHHKEAYVSAYEGYIDGNCYRSSKNKIPSVNFTRSAVRPKARANGLGNSWNIYTYNEHRAICHLFLVEYATRNSQKAVNTALTVEGFRQGGLGSGCTTGTVTINGATTYLFIPTGSSDSLGSGSGEVTVTIQQTDSSGSNTTTTTRKCNRYRGIENPFGHVWKNTDDVISVYISGYGARFWYKCDSPDHFGDSISDDNPYYKNIAANAVVTGYKTKIVTTSTCDFFALSCNNGSETTYWCDYNWDNTDGSLHCLLIGGNSGPGGGAGLFALASYSGVGTSGASVGSRLTYLPWAE